MSTDSVTTLLEEAHDIVDYWDGTIMGALLRHDMETKDYDALRQHVVEAKALSEKSFATESKGGNAELAQSGKASNLQRADSSV